MLLLVSKLKKGVSFLDYGCGRGDDLRLLREIGIKGNGWDPFWRPEGTKTAFTVVNLGFVLNVIESPKERAAVLRDAWNLTLKLLAVATLIPEPRVNSTPYRDGCLTGAGTFQRDFRKDELFRFLKNVLPDGKITKMKRNLFFVEKQRNQKTILMGKV